MVAVTDLRGFAGPLTTTFTPAPSCTNIQWGGCGGGGARSVMYGPCSAQVYSWRCGTSMKTECYPEVATTYTEIKNIYSPASICPLGWRTAATETGTSSLSPYEAQGTPAGVWCCPSGLTWRGDDQCGTIVTQATITATKTIDYESCDTRETVLIVDPHKSISVDWMAGASFRSGTVFSTDLGSYYGTIQVEVAALGVLLVGQTLDADFSRTFVPGSLLSTSIPSATKGATGDENSGAQDSPPDNKRTIGLAVGLSVGLTLLFGIGIWLLWRYRKQNRRRDASNRATSQFHDQAGKPELDATTAAGVNEIAKKQEPLTELDGAYWPQTRELDSSVAQLQPDMHNSTLAELEGPQSSTAPPATQLSELAAAPKASENALKR